MEVKCCICGQNVFQVSKRGAYLKRVNPKGALPMVVRCFPDCKGTYGDWKDALLNAIEGDNENVSETK